MTEDGHVDDEGDDFIVISVGDAVWRDEKNRYFLEEDYKINGEKWRVHKSDPDPLPSNPHAHCIAGSDRFLGCKLHLGTRELFSSRNKPLGRYLDEEQFERLIVLVRRKFPGLTLPLKSKADPD